MNTLNFNHLYYFVVIAREGSITKACKKLFITQPTLSGQLAQLEEYFGKKLFDRKNRRLKLNQNGEVVLSYATQIFKLRDEMLSATQKETDKDVTRVHLGVLPSVSKSHVNEITLRFLRRSGTEIQITEGDVKTLFSALKVGEVDIVLSDNMVSTSQHAFLGKKLFSREMVAVATKKWKSRTRRGKFPLSLDKEPYVTFTQHSRIRDEIDLYFYSKHVSPCLVGEMDDVTLLRLAAESGNCFAILPKNAAKEAISDGRLVVLGYLKEITSDLWIITKKGSKLEPLVQTIIDRLRKEGLRNSKRSRS